MNKNLTPCRSLGLPLLGALMALASAPLFAQQTAPAAPTPPAPAASTAGESTVTMDPFEVQESHDTGYGTLNSNSITAFNTALDKMPVSADVFDQSFMNDTAFTTVEQMIDTFSAGAGNSATQSDLAAQNGQLGDRPSNGTTSVRGLSAPSVLVNGFFPVGAGGVTGGGQTSTFDLEKVEIVNGPQALLYGVSGAGGAINFTTKQARLGTPAFGEEKFQVDQYGHKLEQLDLGEGTDDVAVRVAVIDQTLGTRRVFLGGPMEGAYAQIAARPVQNTTIRVSVEKQTYDRVYQTYQPTSFTASSTSNDARNGDDLRYLLATNQLQAAANGAPSGGGPIPGLNWNNIDSIGGDLQQEYRDYDRSTVNIDTTWTSWLTSSVAAGYSATTDSRYSDVNQVGYDAPNVSANPTGTFAMVLSSTVAAILSEPSREKAARASLLADNQLIDGKVDSKTVIGADANRSDNGTIEVFYVQADSNFNLVTTPGSSYNGATIIGTLYYGLPNGPVPYPTLYNPMQNKVTINGVNYVRAITNDTDAALISPSNQEGLTGTGKGDFRHSSDVNSGYYLANYSDFLDGNLNTLLGARVGKAYYRNDVEGSTTTNPSILTQANANFVDIDAGINGKVYGPVRAYAEISESENPPTAAAAGPLGEQLAVAKGLGEEVGLKATYTPLNLSAQLAFYHTNSQDEEIAFTSTLINDINPTGLNGQYNAPSNIINVNRSTNGASFTLTAATNDWRFRVSAAYNQATIGTTNVLPEVYNDQFYENAAGDVTYADGAVVYVPATFNSKTLTVASTTSGAVPLTVTALSTPGGQYYTSPVAVTGQISSSSNGYKVLAGGKDPANSASGILTGALGLPISDYQLNTALTGVMPVGSVVLTQTGQASTGVPKYALNFIAVYTVPDGPFKGVFGGPSGSIGWDQALYYYYAQEVSAAGVPETAFKDPTETLFNGLLGYKRKFGRCTFTTQITCNNLFNHYHVLILPSTIDGFLVPSLVTATFDQQPREYVWTTTIGF